MSPAYVLPQDDCRVARSLVNAALKIQDKTVPISEHLVVQESSRD